MAFTGLDGAADQRVSIEYVEGLADELVAGVAVPRSTDSDRLGAEPAPDDDADGPALRQVVEMVRALQERHGHDVDVEWAVDADGPHLLQVRPLTATRGQRNSVPEPVAQTHQLYFDDLPPTFHLGDVAGVYGSYVAKRGPAHRMAHDCGVSVGAGWILQFNGRGLRDATTADALRAALAGGSAECVLDLGDTLRQIVVPRKRSSTGWP
ncbi:hypothetical protein O1L55_35300 [Streptomyces albulus]|nr:hypothetical protein [Streptomyces noursei]